jgi:hypothetical protein
MFKFIYNKFRAFFFDESQFERMGSAAIANLRATIMVAGLSSVAFSEQIAALTDPKHANSIKLAGIVASGLAMMFRAGEKNPKEDTNVPTG